MEAALQAAAKKLRPTKTKITRTPQYYEQKEKLRTTNPELYEELYGDEELVSPSTITSTSKKPLKRLTASVAEAHGLMGDKSWPLPRLVVACDQDARPGYATCKAHEYVDEPDVLAAKVDLLATLIKKSKYFATYTGAGISTASGIGDYASKSKASIAVGFRRKLQNPLAALPTLAHKTLTALYKAGHLKHWVQQNHDGLPQKAGFPQHCLNEIHGAWHDPSNPVVPMSGSLRSDLMSWLVEWEELTDFCLAMGTSLCGMNADRMVTTSANKFIEKKQGFGACIISLQQTDLDSIASLRIFAKIDDVMQLLAQKMSLPVPKKSTMYDWPAHRSAKAVLAEDVFQVPYDAAGNFTKDVSKWQPWNLQAGARVRLTSGPGKGYLGTVVGKSHLGNYAVELPCTREGSKDQGKKRVHYALGPWWVNTAIAGAWPYLPVVNIDSTWRKDSEDSDDDLLEVD